MSFYKYTPALLDSKTLEDTLIGRDIELDNLKRILKSASTGRSLSHAILIGPKGIGKTHILRIINHAVKGEIKTKGLNQFKNKYIPVIFPEEEYLGSLTKLIILTLRYIDELKVEGIPHLPEDLIKPATLSEKKKEFAITYLRTFKKKTNKSLLLLIDNINDIIERFTEEDQSSLRDMLMTFNSILLIGAAPTLFDSIVNHDKPLYNFFEIIWLKELPFKETISMLNRYAKIDGRRDLIKEFKKNEPKLRAIHELAGGNPRLILSLYHIILEGDITSVESTFLKLLDELSPYFRERMKDLSAQQREIIDIIARAGQLLTPTEISGRCYMSVTVVNAQLKRLDQTGYVIKSGKKRAKKVLYDLNEKLFRLWRQMRVEAGRKRLGFIVKFLEMWFSKKELLKFLDITFKEIRDKIQAGEISQIELYMDKVWYIKEAITEFKDEHAICVACERKNFNSALAMITESLKTNPNDTAALNRLGCIKRSLGKYNEAVDALKRSLKLNPKDDKALTLLGLIYGKDLKRYEEAKDAFLRAIEANPNSTKAWNNLGTTLANLKKYEKAVEAFKQALQIKSDDDVSWFNLGLTLGRNMKQYEEAKESLRKAVQIKSKNSMYWNNLGIVYGKLKDNTEAINAFNKAIEIDPKSEFAWFNLGLTLGRNMKQYEEAKDAFLKATDINPKYTAAWNNLGNTYISLGEYAKAVESFKLSLKMKADDYKIWTNLGHAYLHLSQYNKAIEADKKAVEIKMNDDSLFNLISTYIYIFKLEGVEGDLQSALKNLKYAINYLNKLNENKAVLATFISAFKYLVKAKKIELLKIALNEIKRNNLPDFLEALKPYITLNEYMETKNHEIIERLRYEERIVVDEMIKMLEGKTGKKSKQKKKVTTKRKKKD